MKKSILLLLYFPYLAFAQSKNGVISNAQLKRFLNQQFTSLVTGQSKFSMGSFASYEIKDSKLDFAGSYVDTSSNVFNFKATGAISDGITSIFSNSKLNSGISIDLKYNIFLNKKKSAFTYYDSSWQSFITKNDEINSTYEKKKFEILNEEKKNEMLNSKFKLKKDIHLTKRKLEKIDSLLHIELNMPQKDSLTELKRNENVKFQKLIFDSKKLSEDFVSLPDTVEQLFNLHNEYSDKFEANVFNPKMYAFHLQWVSFGYNVGRNAFRLYDDSLKFANQITKKSFLGHQFSVQFSDYNWTKEKGKTRYFSIGLSYTIQNNLSDLTSFEITDEKKVVSNNISRVSSQKYKVYKNGDYVSNNNTVSFYADYYKFLFKDNPVALHLYPQVNVTNKETITNFGIGFLFSFLDSKKDDKSKFNAELYYNINDLGKITSTNSNILKSNDIGLRVTFPISFKMD